MRCIVIMQKRNGWSRWRWWGRRSFGEKLESRMWRCNYCTKKNTACHWPSTGSKAHLCSQCREHKVTCVVGGEVNKKRKEWGSPESVVRWWAWHPGMTRYPSIFAFLVFLLRRWLTMMHGTDATLHASCASPHDRERAQCSIFVKSLLLATPLFGNV